MIFVPSSLTTPLTTWRNVFVTSSSAKSPRHNLSSRIAPPSHATREVPTITQTKLFTNPSSRPTISNSSQEVPTITLTKPPPGSQPDSYRPNKITRFTLSEDEVRSISLSGYYYRFQRPKRAILNRLMKNDHTLLSNAEDRAELLSVADEIDVDSDEEQYGAYGSSLREVRRTIYSLVNENHQSTLGKELLGLLNPPKDPNTMMDHPDELED